MSKKFGYSIKAAVFALGLAVFGLAPAAHAFADQKGRHYSKPHYEKHHYGHYKYRHQPRYRSHYRGHYRGHHHSGGGEAVLGLMAGGLLVYALTANQRSSAYDQGYDRKVYVREQPVSVQPPQTTWVRQQPAQPQDASCLQVREYQTTITVGNQSVPAYGQSCLQPDGSWKLGPATPEPAY